MLYLFYTYDNSKILIIYRIYIITLYIAYLDKKAIGNLTKFLAL